MVTRIKGATEFHPGIDPSCLGRERRAEIGMASGKKCGAKRAYTQSTTCGGH